VVRTRGLRKEFGRAAGLVRAVDGVDLEVAAGETVAVMGPSGCGKSTLLHLLGGLDRPSVGELWLDGRRVDQMGAARTSTVSALADAARPPRRRAALIAISARLPVPLLLGLRLLARRPRRGVLNALSIAVTVTGIVAILASHTFNARGYAGLDNLKIDRLNELTVIITVMLVILAAANTTFISWATVLDASRSSALARALGATPRQVSAGLLAAQLLPALPGTIVGIPAGIYLYRAMTHNQLTVPPLWQLLAVLAGTLLVVTGLTAIPARLGARRPPAEILQSE